MKILIIDPRCVDASSSYYYVVGLASALAEHAEVTLVSVKKCHIDRESNIQLKNIFYPISENMRSGKLRQIIRGIEYVLAYIYLWFYTLGYKYDIIHVEWPIVYKFDKVFFKLLKKHAKRFILKAHNVLPHSTGDKLIPVFRNIYAIPSKIIVHGEGMRKELIGIYPEYKEKVIIQRHGTYFGHDLKCRESDIDENIKKRINECNRVYLFYGRIDRDKGLDRLVSVWIENFKNSDSLLVIAGKVSPSYVGFETVARKMTGCSNILFLPGYVEDNLSNYLFLNANLIILPYIKGSMSGVSFTASEFSKPVLTTRFGSIEEYITNDVTGYVVENTDEALKEKLLEIDSKICNDNLSEMGKKMHCFYEDNFKWDTIAEKLMKTAYDISL